MTLILQISDTHFGTERPPVVEALVELVARQKPDVLILSGDITQRARPEQFQVARKFVDRLQISRVLTIPGNHDISLFNLGARLLSPYEHYRRHFGPELEPELDLPDLLVLAVNTTRRWRHVDGEVSTGQIERVAKRLAAATPQQLRIVVTHQPVAVSRVEDMHNLLHGHAQAIQEWAASGADLILGGHIHLPYVRALHEADHALGRPIWAVQAGTALSHRLRHDTENSVNLIRTPAAGAPAAAIADVERWDFDPATVQFVVQEQHCLNRSGYGAA
ncbi:MAG: metallophosphoesterase [Ideonella sp.]